MSSVDRLVSRTETKVRSTGFFTRNGDAKAIIQGRFFKETLEEHYPLQVKVVKIGDYLAIPTPDLTCATAANQLVGEILDGHFK